MRYDKSWKSVLAMGTTGCILTHVQIHRPSKLGWIPTACSILPTGHSYLPWANACSGVIFNQFLIGKAKDWFLLIVWALLSKKVPFICAFFLLLFRRMTAEIFLLLVPIPEYCWCGRSKVNCLDFSSLISVKHLNMLLLAKLPIFVILCYLWSYLFPE